MSSMCSAVLANSSLTSMPLSPYGWNLNGEGNAAPVFRSVRSVSGSGCPACFASAGLGSNVSTCDGPPLQKKWITRFALPAKCGCFGANGLAASARFPSSHNRPARPRAPRPMPGAAREAPGGSNCTSWIHSRCKAVQQSGGHFAGSRERNKLCTSRVVGLVSGDFFLQLVDHAF